MSLGVLDRNVRVGAVGDGPAGGRGACTPRRARPPSQCIELQLRCFPRRAVKRARHVEAAPKNGRYGSSVRKGRPWSATGVPAMGQKAFNAGARD
jgi:hypothetical protein